MYNVSLKNRFYVVDVSGVRYTVCVFVLLNGEVKYCYSIRRIKDAN